MAIIKRADGTYKNTKTGQVGASKDEVIGNIAPTISPQKSTTSPTIQNTYKYVDTLGNIKQVSANTPEEAMTSVKDIDPRSGVQLITPTPTPTAQQTTTSERLNYENDTNRFYELRNQLTQFSENVKTRKKVDETEDEDYDPYDIKSQTRVIEREAQRKIDDINDQLSSIQAKMDQASGGLIEGIKTKYQARIKAMEETNRRNYALKQNLGFRHGRARYAPGVESAILTDEELSGYERISELEGNMLSLIAEAEMAQAENDYKLFTQKYNMLEEVYKNTQTEIKNMYDMAVEQEKAIREKEKAERDAQKAEFELSLNKAEAAAPALAEKLKNFSTTEEKQAFIDAYAKAAGITDSDVLFGALDQYLTEEEKSALDIEAKRAGISSTYVSTSQKQRELEKERTKDAIRADLYASLSAGEITFKEAKDVWVTADLSIPDFDKEFSEFEE